MSYRTFDHHAVEIAEDREAVFKKLRQECPMGRSENYEGFWVVVGNEAVHDVLRDEKNFSVERDADGGAGIILPAVKTNPSLKPGETEGSLHTHYRKVLNQFFNRRSVEKKRAMIERITDEALDAVSAKSEFDVVSELGNLVPINTVLEWLGLPVGNGMKFLEAVERGYITDPEHGDVEAAVSNFQKVWDETSEVIEAKRKDPGDGDDILGTLIRQPEHNLSLGDLLEISLSVVLGGTRTTGALIAHCLYLIDTQPGIRERLQADPLLVRSVIEETMRFASPSVSLARTAVAPVEYGGNHIAAGDRLLVVFASANYDETVFDNPRTFDVDRQRAHQHVGFGYGAHRCVGEWLARLEAEIVLTKVLERLPAFTIDTDRAKKTRDQGVLSLWEVMPCLTNRDQ
jgi:cytochrome P450